MPKGEPRAASEGGNADKQFRSVGRYHPPSGRECALLILRLMQAREQEVVGRGVSRARISQSTLRILCGRSQIANDLLLEIQEFLLAGGWCLFCVGPTHFAIIKRKAVDGWARIAGGRIKDEITAALHGEYNFEPLEQLLIPKEADDGDVRE